MPRHYPQEARAKEKNEAAFAARIHSALPYRRPVFWATTMCAFDDEVTTQRFIVISTIPTPLSWQHDNSRWDLLDVMRLLMPLRPEGINWPEMMTVYRAALSI